LPPLQRARPPEDLAPLTAGLADHARVGALGQGPSCSAPACYRGARMLPAAYPHLLLAATDLFSLTPPGRRCLSG
jgi:hypothetical protein